MKNVIILFLLILITILFNSCVDETVVNAPNDQGKVVINSNPPGAKIFLIDAYTNQVTPDSLSGLKRGSYQLTLKKINYYDTTINVEVDDKLKTIINVQLKEKKAMVIYSWNLYPAKR